MMITRTKDSIILEKLTKEEKEFFDDQIEFWEFLQEKKRASERFEEILKRICESGE